MHLFKEHITELAHKIKGLVDFCMLKKTAFARRSRTQKTVIAAVLLVALVSCGTLYYLLFSPTGAGREAIIIDVPPGSSLQKIIGDLQKANLVKSRLLLQAMIAARGSSAYIKAGEYEIEPRFSQWDIARMFAKGITKKYKIVIPEDWTVAQIAKRLEANGLINYKTFIALARDPVFLSEMKIPARSVEGFLYPETYYFERITREHRIMAVMIGQFWKVFTPQLEFRARELGFSLQEAIALASMIGKEASVAEEKPLVSAVFHNRLRLGMRLQSDPTAVYKLERYTRRITPHDLRVKSRHNTYMMVGLPRCPIANPGKDSIVAALYPADVDYIYFVYSHNGGHMFSSSYRDHVRAVNKLRKTPKGKSESSPVASAAETERL